MSSLAILAILLAAAVAVYFVGRAKAQRAVAEATVKPHSRPPYHGAYLAIWTVLPALLLLALWSAAEGPVLRQLIYRDMPASALERSAAERSLDLSVVNSIAEGLKKLSPEQYQVIRKARYGFITTDEARDVLADRKSTRLNSSH